MSEAEKDWCEMAQKWTDLISWSERTLNICSAIFLGGGLLSDLCVVALALQGSWMQVFPITTSVFAIYFVLMIRSEHHKDTQRWLKERTYCLTMRDVIRSYYL